MTTAPRIAPGGRLVALYVGLAVATAFTVVAAISAGSSREPEPAIAGGYDVARGAGCLGQTFELRQSGRFVDLDNANRSLGGKLEFHDGRLTGDVACVGGERARLDARSAAAGLAGTVGGRPFAAALAREPARAGQSRPRAPGSIRGDYTLAPRSACLGAEVTFDGDGASLTVKVGKRPIGRARYEGGNLRGRLTCPAGGARTLTGRAANRRIQIFLAPEGSPAISRGAAAAASERLDATKRRDAGSLFAAFFLAVTVVMLAARLLGMGAAALGQPRVMGEVVAGIALGPSILGAVAPALQSATFPEDVVPAIGVVAQLGLVFYMFLVGLELDLRQLRGRGGQVAAISNASVTLPMILGVGLAYQLYEPLAPVTDFAAFALFMGVSMSVTAFPVLARILVERRMLRRPVGAVALASAAVDDVTAWFLIAVASAVAVASSSTGAIATVALAGIFSLVMLLGVRPLLARVSVAYDEAGRVPGGWIALIFAGVLLSAYVTEQIGIALIFGAFMMGLIMPRHAELTEDVTRRMEDFVATLLLPLFFAYTGLRLDIGLLDRPELWAIGAVILVLAIAGKLLGAMMAARLTGFDWRSAAVIGTLMNTRGLTELIVLNLALEKGVISEALFAMLVIMALVTTGMAGPALTLLDRRNELGAPLDEELGQARTRAASEFPDVPVPTEAVIVAPQADAGLQPLLALAEPLAGSEPPRELILARLVRPPVGADVSGGLQTENRLLAEASKEVERSRRALMEKGVAARAVAFISGDPGRDLSRLAATEEVALVLMDGRRPLLGEAVPRGEVGTVLREAPSDVAVLVTGDADLRLDGSAVVMVAFGGKQHDWAALELGAWLCSATRARLKVLGAAGEQEGRARVSRLLGDAGLIVQQYAGVMAEPVVTDAGRDGIVAAAGSAQLLILGLSDQWRDEGLGPTRSEIARAAPAPVLFVRRGERPGALAPRGDVTRFSWSSPGAVDAPREIPPR